MAARVPVEPCAGKSGYLSGERRLAGSSTKLRVWGRPIRDPVLAVVVPLRASPEPQAAPRRRRVWRLAGRRRGVVTSSLVVLSPSPGLSLTQTK